MQMYNVILAAVLTLAPGAVLCILWRRRLAFGHGLVVLLLGWPMLAIVLIDRMMGDE